MWWIPAIPKTSAFLWALVLTKFFTFSGQCCPWCCTYPLTAYNGIGKNWYSQPCAGCSGGELYKVLLPTHLIGLINLVALVESSVCMNNISLNAGKYIWLEDVDQYKQLVLQKSYVKFLVILAFSIHTRDINLNTWLMFYSAWNVFYGSLLNLECAWTFWSTLQVQSVVE